MASMVQRATIGTPPRRGISKSVNLYPPCFHMDEFGVMKVPDLVEPWPGIQGQPVAAGACTVGRGAHARTLTEDPVRRGGGIAKASRGCYCRRTGNREWSGGSAG